MKGRLRELAAALARWAITRAAALGRAVAARWRRNVEEGAPPARRRTADERSLRRQAEAERGGISSTEGVARWERGDNPGGLHQRARRSHDADADRAPERERPEHDEPTARHARAPGGERHLPETRRGG